MGNTDIGVRLKQAREAAGLKQKEVCEELNIPKTQTISSYERGVNNPPVETLGELAKLYKVSTDWLIFGAGADNVKEKTNADYVLELLEAADALGLVFDDMTDMNGEHRYYFIRLENAFLTKFDLLIESVYKLRVAREVLEDEDYQTLLRKRIATSAAESGNFKYDPLYAAFGEVDDNSGLPF